MKKCPKCGVEYKDTSTLCPADGTALENLANALVGRTLAGKYRVDEVISEGGMGTVYQATHILMDKKVAIKVLHPALAADSVIVARFSREARAASRISHPHAISVTDFGESEDGIVFLVMEFLNGRTLKEVIKARGPLPLQRVVEIMRQVCGALEAAHAEGVIHRDLKSDNIMLLDVSEGDWIKVLDFGIAKIQEPAGQDQGLTSPDLVIGTPQYMSPEQCSQMSEIDARSDVYSLGIIIYELLAGHVPFTGESPTTIMFKHLQEAPPDLQTERNDLSRDVARVVARALAKDPQNRFQTVKELRESLTLAAEASSVPAAIFDEESRQDLRPLNRIIVQTGSGLETYDNDPDSDDEITIVHPNTPVQGQGVPSQASSGAPPQTANANSWKFAAISLLGVLLIGGILYVMSRDRQAASDKLTPPLTVDPNSQPVKPSGPPTGDAEKDIVSKPPEDNTNANANENTNTANSNVNQNIEPINENANTNENVNTQQNNNLPGANPSPNSNTGSNRNNNSPADVPAPRPTPPKAATSPAP